MLRITVPGKELFDEAKSEFISDGTETVLDMEHSLISLSKWESKHQIPFLSNAKARTPEELLDYIKTMVLTPDYPENVFSRLSEENFIAIHTYLESSQSATTFEHLRERGGPGEVITSELIYYWLVAFTIPFEAQFWNLNRLFTLIRICSIKNDPKGNRKMSRHEVASRNRSLNAQRKEKLGTRG